MGWRGHAIPLCTPSCLNWVYSRNKGGSKMISSTRVFFVLCAFVAVGVAQNPANFFQPSGNVPLASEAPKPALSTETRGDIYMARKMYREAIDMYRQGPANSAVLANKIGIAFHQMSQLDLARKNY